MTGSNKKAAEKITSGNRSYFFDKGKKGYFSKRIGNDEKG